MPTTEPKAVDQSGRALGPRALHTRQRLLDATVALLAERSVRDVSVVEIARKADTSPATFYQYFKDVGDATLVLADQAAEEMPAVLELIDGPWRGQKGLDTARAIVRAFVDHWDAYRAVLLVRNLWADEGDRRFMKVRRRALSPVIEHLAKLIETNQAQGRIAKEVHPAAAAAAMASILERLSAYHREIEYFGAGREELIESCARILFQTVTGRGAP
ncbi:MAG: TetR family transcriptional regulator [Myxococcota bacterium]|nr:TetR family transcriptional regulator [Myxococcota bacterium]